MHQLRWWLCQVGVWPTVGALIWLPCRYLLTVEPVQKEQP